jgi:hypothetical protein
MLYDSTKGLLNRLLSSVESADQAGWDGPVELGGECLYEMHQMARPLYQGYRLEAGAGRATASPVSVRAARAIPHVKLMVRAIRRKDRDGAVESGRAALAEM